MKTSFTHYCLLTLGLALLLSAGAQAQTFTNLAYWRMGEIDPGGAGGLTATATTDVLGSALRFPNGVTYLDSVADTASRSVRSRLDLRIVSGQYGTNNLVTRLTDNFAIELWVKPASTNNVQCIAYNGSSSSDGWGLYILNGQYIGLFGGVGVVGSMPATSGVWSHLALLRDNGTARLYVNGVPAGAASAAAPHGPTGHFAVGARPLTLAEEFFAGEIDELRIISFAPGTPDSNLLLLVNLSIEAVTLPATGVSNTLATLNGIVNPGGQPAIFWFEWGLTANYYTQQSPPTPLTASATSLAVSQSLTGFTPGLIYHGRVAASNVFGLLLGRDIVFGAPSIRLNGTPVFTNECHTGYTNVPAAGRASPLAIDGGEGYSLGLKSDGTVVAWGQDGQSAIGEMSVPPGLSNVTAIAAGDIHALALKSDGKVVIWGWVPDYTGPTNVPPGLSNVTAISAGQYHSLALKSDGTVLPWGINNFGQTNVPSGLSNVVAISASGDHNLAVKSDGTVVAWGKNDYGQANVPLGLSNVITVDGGFLHSLALKKDGTVVAWGFNLYGQANVPAGLSNVVAIAAGGYHNLAMKRDGTVIVWGLNDHGQTNVPPGTTNVVGIGAGFLTSMALTSDGTVVAWGNQSTIASELTAAKVTLTGVVNADVPGNYTLTYLSQNNFLGSIGSATRVVVVADTIPPVIVLNGSNPMIFTNGSRVFTDPGATALDVCAGSLPVTVSNAVNVNFPGTYFITYRCTDPSGNSASNTRAVMVALPSATPGDLDGDGLVSPSELEQIYAQYLLTSPGPAMTNVTGLGGTNVTFALSPSLLGDYNVEYSTNLLTWFPLGTARSRYSFNDTNATAGLQRFYRLRLP